jgi:hypothetical protein
VSGTQRKDVVDDAQIHSMIEQLVAEEHRLWQDEANGGNTEEDSKKLAEVKVALDKCWDLLRQRRAYSENRLDPDAAQPRDESVVENYLQ